MNGAILPGFLLALCCLSGASPALAVSIELNPSSQAVSLGDLFFLDVVISGLEEGEPDQIVSAFDLNVTYDSTILSATAVSFGSCLGDPELFEALTDMVTDIRGIVDFAEVSLLADSELADLQPDTFVLATLSFVSLSPGTSSLSFAFDASNDLKGRDAAVLALEFGRGSVEVVPAAVPEPASLLLLGAGMIWLVGLRKSSKGQE